MTVRVHRLIWPRSLTFETAIKSAAELRRMARFLPWPLNMVRQSERDWAASCVHLRMKACQAMLNPSMLDAQWALRDRYQDERIKRWEEKNVFRSKSA